MSSTPRHAGRALPRHAIATTLASSHVAQRRMRHAWLAMLLVLAALAIPAARGTDFNASCLADTNAAGTNLLNAVIAANNAPDGGNVLLVPGCVYTMTSEKEYASAFPVILKTITLRTQPASGVASASITRSSNNAFRFFLVGTEGNLTLQNVVLSKGQAPGGGKGSAADTFTSAGNGSPGQDGGGIYNYGVLTLDHVLMAENSAGRGGDGGDCYTSLLVTRGGGSAGRSGQGGAIYNVGTLTVRDTYLRFNHAADGASGGSCGGGVETRGGNGATGGSGGAIYSEPGATALIQRSTIFQNTGGKGGWPGTGPSSGSPNMGYAGSASSGAGIYSAGTLTIEDSTIEGNVAGGGMATQLNPAVHSDLQGGNGGWGAGVDAEASGITGKPGSLTIRRSTFTSNIGGGAAWGHPNGAQGAGGAININVPATIENSTFYRNLASDDSCNPSEGGAINVGAAGSATIKNSTFSGNQPGKGDFFVDNCTDLAGTYGTFSGTGRIELYNSVLVGGTDPSSGRSVTKSVCSPNVVDMTPGHNTFAKAGSYGWDDGGPFCPGTMVQLDPKLQNPPASPSDAGRDPSLGPPVMMPDIGSPIAGLGDNAACTGTDERGVTRPQGGTCDIGAVEVRLLITQQPSPAVANVVSPGTATFTATADTEGLGAPTVQWQVSVNGGAFANVSGGTASGPFRVGSTSTYTTSYQTPGLLSSGKNNRYRVVFTNTAVPAPGVASSPASVVLTYGPEFTEDLPPVVRANVGGTASLPITVVGYPTVGTIDLMVSKDDGATWSRNSGLPGSDIGLGGSTTYQVLCTPEMAAATQAGHSWRYRVHMGGYPGGSPKDSSAARVDVTNNPVPPSIAPFTTPFDNVIEGYYTLYLATVGGNPSPTIGWQVSSDGSHWTDLVPNQDGYWFQTQLNGSTITSLQFVAWGYLDGLRYRPVVTSPGNPTGYGTEAKLRVRVATATSVTCPARVVTGTQFVCSATVTPQPQQGPLPRAVVGDVVFIPYDANQPALGRCTLDAQGHCSVTLTAQFFGPVPLIAHYSGPAAVQDWPLADLSSDGQTSVLQGTCFDPELTCPAQLASEADAQSCNAPVEDFRSQLQVTALGCTPTLYQNPQPGMGEQRPVGTYPIHFQAVADGGSAMCDATVVVHDNSPGTITLLGGTEEDVECGFAYNDQGAFVDQTCSDSHIQADTPLPSHQAGDFTLTYTAHFGQSGSGSATRLVHVHDSLRPNIELIGPSDMVVDLGTPWVDPGAVGHDVCEGDIAAIPDLATIDTSTPNTYFINYRVTDHAGNQSSVNRRVEVLDITRPRLNQVTAVSAGGQRGSLADGYGTAISPRNFDLVFSEPMNGGRLMVSTYLVIGAGADGVFQTPPTQCGASTGDLTYNLGLGQYDPQTFATATLQGAQSLPEGKYRLMICGGLSDNGGNTLLGPSGNAPEEPYVLSFTVDSHPPQVLTLATNDEGLVSAPGTLPAAMSPPTRINLIFNELLRDPAGNNQLNDVTNPQSYRLLKLGTGAQAAPASCLVPPNPGDTTIAIDAVTALDQARRANLDINGGTPLADGTYRFFLCAANGPRDFGGNTIDGNRDGADGDDYVLDFLVDTTPPTNPPLQFDRDPGEWSNNAALQASWPPGLDLGGIGVSGYALHVAPGAQLSGPIVVNMPAGATNESSVPLAEGDNYVYLATCDWLQQCSTYQMAGPFRLDSRSPGNPSQLASPDHTPGPWSPDRHLSVNWSADATDPPQPPATEASGLAGYAYVFDHNPSTQAPTTVQQPIDGPRQSSIMADEGVYYFHLRTCDRAGNCSATMHLGPFQIDATPPTQAVPASPDHAANAYSNDPHLSMLWDPPTDAGSGVAGCSYAVDNAPLTDVDTTLEGGPGCHSAVVTLPGDGTYYFHVRSCDVAGNCSATVHAGPYTIDSVAPVNAALSSSTHTAAQWKSSQHVVMNWSGASDAGAGVAGYSYAFDGSATTVPDATLEGTASTASADLADGANYYFHLRTCDKAGNCSAAAHYGPIQIDTTLPTLAAPSSDHAPNTFSAVAHVGVSWSAANDAGSGVAGYSYVFDTSASTVPDATLEQAGAGPNAAATDFTDGSSYYFHLRACDAAGNCSAAQHIGPFKIDTAAPSNPTPAGLPGPDWVNNPHVSVSWAGAADAGSGVKGYSVLFDHAATTTPPATINQTAASIAADLGEGADNYLHLRTCDNVGNCSAPLHIGPYKIDTTAPGAATLDAGRDLAAWSANGHVSVSWSGASDAASGVAGYSVLFDSSPASVPDASLEVSEAQAHTAAADLPDGADRYFHLRSCDAAGNCGAAQHLGPFKIDTTAPSAAAVTLDHNANSWSANATVQVQWGGSTDAGSGLTEYRTLFDTSAASVPTASHTPSDTSLSQDLPDGANHYFHIRACDALGNCSAPQHFGPFQIDTAAPTEAVPATTHAVAQWSADKHVSVTWSGATDAGAGVAGYSFAFDHAAGTDPDATLDSTEAAPHTAAADLADGSDQYFHVRACDGVGHCGATRHLGPFQIDTTAPANPTLASAHGISQWSSDKHVSVTWSGASDAGSGIAGYSFVFDESAGTTPDAGIDAGDGSASADLADGATHWFHLRSCDTAGNCSAAVHYGPFQIDTTAPAAPSATADHTAGEWSRVKQLNLQWSAVSDGAGAGVGGYSYVFDSAPATDPDTTTEVLAAGPLTAGSDLDDGAGHYFHLRSCDTLGQCSATVHYGPYRIDTTLPANPAISSSTHAVNQWNVHTLVQLALTGASDAGSGVQGFAFVQDTSAGTDPGESVTIVASASPQALQRTLADGDGQWLHLRTCDVAGNCAAPVHFGPLRIDHTAPTPVTLYTSPSHVIGEVSGNAVIDLAWDGAGDATSGVGGYRWRFDQDAAGSCEGGGSGDASVKSASSTALSEGTWYAHLCVVDVAGNRGDVDTLGPFPLDLTGPHVTAVAAVGRHDDSELSDGAQTDLGITQLEVRFNESLRSSSLAAGAFQLYAAGADGLVQTQACNARLGDDVGIVPLGVLVHGAPDAVALRLGDYALPRGHYRLLVCPGVKDSVGNAATTTRLDFGVTGTNLAANPNFDSSDRIWTMQLPAGAQAAFDAEDAGGAWSSGSLLLSNGAPGAAPWSVSQCVRIHSLPHRAQADVKVTGSAAVDVFLDVVLYAGEQCQSNPSEHFLSNNRIGVRDTWATLAAAFDKVAGSYGSALVSVQVDSAGESGVRVKLDNLGLVVDSDEIFANGFEAPPAGR